MKSVKIDKRVTDHLQSLVKKKKNTDRVFLLGSTDNQISEFEEVKVLGGCDYMPGINRASLSKTFLSWIKRGISVRAIAVVRTNQNAWSGRNRTAVGGNQSRFGENLDNCPLLIVTNKSVKLWKSKPTGRRIPEYWNDFGSRRKDAGKPITSAVQVPLEIV